ncbi:FhuF 2Fe-2S C-terminal domain-containing protein [Nocardioides scoriae]|uniref:FhuF 2Fe-2S C-terminal domain-containing protein n=1 Tax=Nocardioides scoriae TaxID=642780 RepID=A0A1H1U4K7_9ACTN|nr:(2Fe-2S)-binding protein [Nocardioides scoriae]SDS67337.1 FhuF 2Fe-2S C-terminal domain-containing protein [Nocardioides scoriae]
MATTDRSVPVPVPGVVADAAALGPWFAASVAAPGEGWLTLAELTSPERLDDLLARTRTAIAVQRRAPVAAVEVRVAASSLHLALLGRVTSVALGALALGGSVLALGAQARWRPTTTHAVDLGLAAPLGTPAGSPDEALALLHREVLDTLVVPLGLALRERARVSPRVLSGNATSSWVGALSALHHARPDLVPQAAAYVSALLHDPLLRPTWTPVRGGAGVRRTSCCLFWRLPGGGVCGDCVLHARTG